MKKYANFAENSWEMLKNDQKIISKMFTTVFLKKFFGPKNLKKSMKKFFSGFGIMTQGYRKIDGEQFGIKIF